MEKQKLVVERWRVQRAVVELLRSMSAQDALRVLAFARRIHKK
jgi:hypothetical protein